MCIGLSTGTAPTVVNQLPDGTTDEGCRADYVTKRNAAGDFTYVLGTESQRSAIELVPAVTFLPFSATQPRALHLLLFRDMLVSPDFPYSTQGVTQIGTPSAAASAMGQYYPRASICQLSTLVTGGAQACEHGG